jgi:hypothetical protein
VQATRALDDTSQHPNTKFPAFLHLKVRRTNATWRPLSPQCVANTLNLGHDQDIDLTPAPHLDTSSNNTASRVNTCIGDANPANTSTNANSRSNNDATGAISSAHTLDTLNDSAISNHDTDNAAISSSSSSIVNINAHIDIADPAAETSTSSNSNSDAHSTSNNDTSTSTTARDNEPENEHDCAPPLEVLTHTSDRIVNADNCNSSNSRNDTTNVGTDTSSSNSNDTIGTVSPSAPAPPPPAVSTSAQKPTAATANRRQ